MLFGKGDTTTGTVNLEQHHQLYYDLQAKTRLAGTDES